MCWGLSGGVICAFPLPLCRRALSRKQLSRSVEIKGRGIEGVSPPRIAGPSPGTAIWLAFARGFDLSRIWLA